MTMVVGVDVTVVDRIAGALRRNPRFAQRIYTDAEQRYAAAKPERWASRWAAKEAVKKLYGSMGERMPAYKDIEVVRRRGGAPQVHVRGEPTDIALSLTHDGGLAIAVAVNRTGGRRHALPEAPEGFVLAARPDDGNKGTFGRVLVIAGSKHFTGAPRLCAMGAARGGAGLVEVCVPESIHAIVAVGCLEIMPTPLPDAGTGVLHPDALPTIRERLKGADALVIGPGLGRAPETVSALLDLLVGLPCPAVVDADALNIVAEFGLRLETLRTRERRDHAAPRGDGAPCRHGHESCAGGSPHHCPAIRAALWSCRHAQGRGNRGGHGGTAPAYRPPSHRRARHGWHR